MQKTENCGFVSCVYVLGLQSIVYICEITPLGMFVLLKSSCHLSRVHDSVGVIRTRRDLPFLHLHLYGKFLFCLLYDHRKASVCGHTVFKVIGGLFKRETIGIIFVDGFVHQVWVCACSVASFIDSYCGRERGVG